jgi:hypothetical protein
LKKGLNRRGFSVGLANSRRRVRVFLLRGDGQEWGSNSRDMDFDPTPSGIVVTDDENTDLMVKIIKENGGYAVLYTEDIVVRELSALDITNERKEYAAAQEEATKAAAESGDQLVAISVGGFDYGDMPESDPDPKAGNSYHS